MVAKKALGDWLKVLVLLLDEAIVVALILAVLRFLNVKIPLWVALLLGLPAAVVVFIIHVKVIPSFHLKQTTGREAMVGLRGRVVQPLTPVGVVRVEGENWKAESTGDNIEVGVSVEVVGIAGLTLRVVRLAED